MSSSLLSSSLSQAKQSSGRPVELVGRQPERGRATGRVEGWSSDGPRAAPLLPPAGAPRRSRCRRDSSTARHSGHCPRLLDCQLPLVCPLPPAAPLLSLTEARAPLLSRRPPLASLLPLDSVVPLLPQQGDRGNILLICPPHSSCGRSSRAIHSAPLLCPRSNAAPLLPRSSPQPPSRAPLLPHLRALLLPPAGYWGEAGRGEEMAAPPAAHCHPSTLAAHREKRE